MNKKHTLKKTAALLLGLALTVGGTGCGFITTDNQEDLEQKVATVDISGRLKTSANSEYKNYADDVASIVKDLSNVITKRDLVSYFMSTGYQYVEQYGYTYEATFNMLLDGLVSREIMIQYAVAYYLKNGANDGITAKNCKDYIEAELKKVSGKEKALLESHPEVLTLKYFLTDGGKSEAENLKDYDSTVYNLKKSINASLDSLEGSYITAESEEHKHEEARTLPTGVDTEKEDYYTSNYEIYTGRNGLDVCGEYEKLDGSTTATRQKAYNAFLTNLQSYNLINTDKSKGEVEDTADFNLLNYYYIELSSLLGQRLINKYYESLEAEISDKLDETYMQEKYNAYYAQNEQDYQNDPIAFATAMDGASADQFLLYGLKNFGYVYNILIPFSASQNVEYTAAKNRGLTEEQLYAKRAEILNNVKGTDQRSSWISAHDHANYSYEKDGKYYFFDDSFSGTKYEELTQYAGTYAFNGEVTYDADTEEYDIVKNEVDIAQFMQIFEDHINATVEGDDDIVEVTEETATYNVAPYKANGKVDYSKFVRYTGKVDFGGDNAPADFFNKASKQYQALSAVNELMFAYSTDTGCLNTYMGYSVSPYGTNFVKEFEYAAQQVVKEGVGSFAVCATDYGWHIVYCSFAYTANGDAYGVYDHNAKDTEGTFSNLFYESMKESAYTNYATEEQNRLLIEYDHEDCVTRFPKAYKDLLELDK
ncbi:MAG: hypothetical protein E7377_01340 [Clostridiales bacterium]|nr:hypothetical protein [Clostridiales bacterium]